MTHPPQTPDFLKNFYKVYFCIGLLGQLVSLGFGWQAFYSYFLGLFILGFLFFLWDWTTALVLNPDRPSPTLGYLLILLRYGLLGGLFYAIIALFVVNWVWFAIGSIILLPSLLVTAIFFDHRPQAPKS